MDDGKAQEGRAYDIKQAFHYRLLRLHTGNVEEVKQQNRHPGGAVRP